MPSIAAVRELDLPPEGDAARIQALDVAEIVRTLDADDDVVIAAMIQPLLDGKFIEREMAEKRFGMEAGAAGARLEPIGPFRAAARLDSGARPRSGPGGEPAQNAARRHRRCAPGRGAARRAAAENALREAQSGAALQRKLAMETREVYAPLANRLGVWQVKWELEDLAFRYLEPAQYKHIAAALKVRRSERERYIDDLKAQLLGELRSAGIEASIEGRPKHIFSIWRKMQVKQLAFEQLMDIRAARILVNYGRGMLRGARHRSLPVAIHSRRVRRLHRDAEGQFVPFDSYRGDRPRRRAGRDPDSHARNARQFGTRCGGPLALQGRRPRRSSI